MMIQRYVGYIRVSTEEQVGTFSIDSQRRDIETWVKRRGGQLIGVYIDEAISALTTDRPAFKQMRRDAAAGFFDAIVAYRFDRFSRNRVDAIAVKAIFSKDYNVQVFSVLESAKTGDADKNLLFEALMESIAEHYVRDLSKTTRRGKRERAMQGYHNNKAPFGFRKTPDGVLYPHKEEAEVVKLAFELYASGHYSFTDVARMLNDKGFRILGKRRFSNDTVRDMLHNRVYAGYVRYRPARPDGTRGRRRDIEWYEGKHDAIISEELFERCQNNAENKTRDHIHHPVHRSYLLSHLIFCAECVERKPAEDDNVNYGKMRGQCLRDYTLYRCRARDFGRYCSQPTIYGYVVEKQVINFLCNFHPSAHQRNAVIHAVSQTLGDEQFEQRLDDIRSIIKELNFNWFRGFIMESDTYLEKRRELDQVLEQVKPLDDHSADQATAIIDNFEGHWNKARGNLQAEKRLIRLLVARVWIRGEKVVGMLIRPDYYIELP